MTRNNSQDVDWLGELALFTLLCFSMAILPRYVSAL